MKELRDYHQISLLTNEKKIGKGKENLVREELRANIFQGDFYWAIIFYDALEQLLFIHNVGFELNLIMAWKIRDCLQISFLIASEFKLIN